MSSSFIYAVCGAVVVPVLWRIDGQLQTAQKMVRQTSRQKSCNARTPL